MIVNIPINYLYSYHFIKSVANSLHLAETTHKLLLEILNWNLKVFHYFSLPIPEHVILNFWLFLFKSLPETLLLVLPSARFHGLLM